MPTKRDPRWNPKPGDEFLKWDKRVLVFPSDATHALPDYVWLGTLRDGIQSGVDLKQFREWASKDCEVIHAAD